MQTQIDAQKVVVFDKIVSNNNPSILAGFVFPAGQNDIAAGTGGAISVANFLTTINTDGGGDAFTLAAGTQVGQLKKILFVADGGGDGVVTAAFTGANTTLTFSDAGEFATLCWTGSDWEALELGSVITITHAPVLA